MNNKSILLGIAIIICSCDPDQTEPETNCSLLPLYELDYHSVHAAKVFDLRTDPPKELKNGTLEYDLSYQFLSLHRKDPIPYPYSEYFIDSIEFFSPSMADVNILESNLFRTYEYLRNDCQIDLESPEGSLHLELTHSGEEITEKRYAIYDHKSRRVTIDNLSFISDTFHFIEFRRGPFASYEEIINQFALDNPGAYDTIAIERVENRTKE